jgi:hypothetical protein
LATFPIRVIIERFTGSVDAAPSTVTTSGTSRNQISHSCVGVSIRLREPVRAVFEASCSVMTQSSCACCIETTIT